MQIDLKWWMTSVGWNNTMIRFMRKLHLIGNLSWCPPTVPNSNDKKSNYIKMQVIKVYQIILNLSIVQVSIAHKPNREGLGTRLLIKSRMKIMWTIHKSRTINTYKMWLNNFMKKFDTRIKESNNFNKILWGQPLETSWKHAPHIDYKAHKL